MFRKVLSLKLSVLSLPLILTACGGSSTSNLFDEVASLQERAGNAAININDESILGYFEDGGDLWKVEKTKLTYATKDWCDNGSMIEKQISVPIKPIENEQRGVIIVAKKVTIDRTDCLKTQSGQIDSEIDFEAESAVITIEENSTITSYNMSSGYNQTFGYKIFDLE